MHGPLNVKFMIGIDTMNPVDTCYATQDWQQVYHNNNNNNNNTQTHTTREHISMSQVRVKQVIPVIEGS
jgi:hypothetical protein